MHRITLNMHKMVLLQMVPHSFLTLQMWTSHHIINCQFVEKFLMRNTLAVLRLLTVYEGTFILYVKCNLDLYNFKENDYFLCEIGLQA